MLAVLLLMGLVWFGGRTLGWSAVRRLVPVLLLWAAWLAVLIGRQGSDEAAPRDALVWALLVPGVFLVRAYAGWIARLRQRVARKEADRGLVVEAPVPQMGPVRQDPGFGEPGFGAPVPAGASLPLNPAAGAASPGQPPLPQSPGAVRTAQDSGAADSQLLSPAELERYSRHILLREVGGAGQRRLKSARVLVIGAGGLGAPVLQYLAAAGVGQLVVIDDDRVDASNLHRQVIHDEAGIGLPKVASAAARLRAQNPHVSVEPIEARLDAALAEQLFAGVDLILDGTDNFDTRYLANRAAVAAGKPLISGALTQWEGQLALLDPDRGGPCYECIFPERPAEGLVPSCALAGVIGPLPGMIGALMAGEAVKLLTGAGASLRGRLLIWDGLEAEMREIRVRPRADCPVCAGRGS